MKFIFQCYRLYNFNHFGRFKKALLHKQFAWDPSTPNIVIPPLQSWSFTKYHIISRHNIITQSTDVNIVKPHYMHWLSGKQRKQLHTMPEWCSQVHSESSLSHNNWNIKIWLLFKPEVSTLFRKHLIMFTLPNNQYPVGFTGWIK